MNNYKVLNLDYMKALELFKKDNLKFDIIFLDPPYKDECISNILDFISDNNMLNDNGLIICEAEFDTFNKDYDYLELIKNKKYGYKFVNIYRKR